MFTNYLMAVSVVCALFDYMTAMIQNVQLMYVLFKGCEHYSVVL